MKVAVIGSGIAGLAAAHRLSDNAGFDVTLIEREERLGLAANNLCWNDEQGNDLICDLPLRMFNAANWPTLVQLYRAIGAEYAPVDSAQSFSAAADLNASAASVYLTLGNATRPKMSTQWLQASSRRIIADAKRLRRQGRRDLTDGFDRNETLSQYLRRYQFSDEFKYRFLYPTLSSTVCTCSFASLDHYPAVIVLGALDRLTGGESLYRLKYSASDVADRLTAGIPRDRILLNRSVESVLPKSDSVTVRFADGASEDFGHLILATQANTASSLLSNHDEKLTRLLGEISYEDVHVVLHQDEMLMPGDKSAWSTFNMVLSPDAQAAMCTVWMNRFYAWTSKAPLFQTINPTISPREVLAEAKLQRPVVTAASQLAIRDFVKTQANQDSRIWMAGSWASEGIPLLESGVQSAWRVCESIERVAMNRVH